MRFYMSLFKYLSEEIKHINIRAKFGFDGQHSALKGDDNVMTSGDDFINAIKKLDIEWIPEIFKKEIREEMEYDLSNFYPALMNMFKNIFGDISMRKTLEILEPHMNGDKASPKKLHRTISKTTRRIYF
jgi:hypothetical protein